MKSPKTVKGNYMRVSVSELQPVLCFWGRYGLKLPLKKHHFLLMLGPGFVLE